MADDQPLETFRAFKDSFSYGSRNDLSFKFLRGLSDEEAAAFFQGLLGKVVDAFDDDQLDSLLEYVYEWQVRGCAGKARWIYEEGPFTPLTKSLSESRLLLLTSSGHFVDDPKPFGVEAMTQEEAWRRIGDFIRAAPTLSPIPVDTPVEKLHVRHGGYDIRGAQADRNVIFPLDRLTELVAEGIIGELAPTAYSFVGACAQTRLLRRTGPQWVSMIQAQGIDAALLVPA